MKKLRWWGMAFLLLGCAGCGSNNNSTGGARSTSPFERSKTLRVTTTTGMIADAVKAIGDERVEVQALMGPGVDPHLYKATPGDIQKLQSADIVLYNGLHLEGKMADILKKLGEKKPCFAAGEGVPKSDLLSFAASPEFPDPHIWFDAQIWSKAVTQIRDKLIEVDPSSRAIYEGNATAYFKKLKELDNYAKAQIATIPKERRVLVTAHDAFGYFGKTYGIEVVGLQGISTASEASLRDVQRVVDVLVKRKVKAAFVESSVPRRNIEAVVQGARAHGHEVVIGGSLFSDAMGQAGTPEGTYVGMVRHNVDVIVKALK